MNTCSNIPPVTWALFFSCSTVRAKSQSHMLTRLSLYCAILGLVALADIAMVVHLHYINYLGALIFP